MTANEYQQEALVTWTRNPIPERPYLYPALGLVGESGEVADKIKKLYRDRDGELDEEYRQAIMLEISDAMWYGAVLAHELGYTLSEVFEANIKKLRDRQARGVVQGDGDNR